MSQEQFIQNLLKLKDPNIEFQSVKTDENSVFITAKLAPNCSKCRYCGESGLLRNGTKVVNIRIPNINERNAILKLRKQRYLCPKCHHTVIAQTPLVRPHHQISERTRHAIMIALTEDRNVTSIAQQFNVSPVSVNRIINDLGPQIKSRPDDLPKVLCFDEFRSTQRQMSFIALNGETHELVTLLPGRRNQEIIQYFTRHYSLKNRQTVQYVVIDFNAQYQSAIRQLFPKAKIVADNFHLVQMTLQALNQTRVQLMKKYPHTSKAYRLLKHNWRLYLMNYNRLEQRKPQWFAHLRDHLTQEQLVWEGLSLNDKFENTYFVVHQLTNALRQRKYDEFCAALTQSKAVSPQLMSTIKTFKKYQKLIENMMNCPKLSNGPLEGINRKIKQIKRTAYGYRNWSRFNLRIRIELKIKVNKKKIIRK